MPTLCLHGLVLGDFELALRGLLGEGAPLSKASLERLKAGWQQEHATWSRRSLAGKEVAYVWADGVYVKAGLEKEKAAVLVLMERFRKVENATVLLWKLLLVAQKSFRKLDAAEHLRDVLAGRTYEDGNLVMLAPGTRRAA
ncbi:hypothetical protein [Corallococcus exercitus]|uniref:Mutator family transposase n=1 Tax=Corallococcus exercitus TaxID=2316736 RepID=A0A7Y4JNQ1_9BACT|nr:hypothetical protein [Corallococcus exercitus]NOK08103.1 hypothetical protein [Corallococcus exercitus]